MSGADFLGYKAHKAAGQDRDEGDLDESDEVPLGPLKDGVQPPIATDPRQGAFNGLITNDKFCLTRVRRLQLSWPRARGGLRGAAAPQLSGEVTHRGGEHAAAAYLACPAHWRVDANQPAALGPGLPAPPAVGGDEFIRADKGAGVPDPAGGVPCA
jgi:hypothetical protein